MSNNQWTGAQDWNAQPIQPATQDWNAQPQQSGQEWGTQPPAHDWGQPAQEQTNIQPATQDWNAQPQPSGQEWGVSSQPSGQEWGTQAQEHTSAQDWGNQQAAWGAAAQQQQPQWGAQQQGYGNQQQWGPKPPASGLAAIFDFGFKGSMLRGNGLGTVYLVTAICIIAAALFSMIQSLTLYSSNVGTTLWGIFGSFGLAFIALVVVRALLEGMAALVKKSEDGE